MDRFDLERAMEAAAGPKAPMKVLFYCLCRRINAQAREILPEHQPSLTELGRAAGLCRTAVRDNLYRLEVAGWITTYPPAPDKARREHARTRYALHVPGSPEHRQARAAQRPADRRQRRRERLAAAQRRARAAREQLVAAAADEMAAAGRPVTPAQAGEIARRILAGRDVRPSKREVYVRRAIRADPHQFAPPSLPPPPPPPRATAAPPPAVFRDALAALKGQRR